MTKGKKKMANQSKPSGEARECQRADRPERESTGGKVKLRKTGEGRRILFTPIAPGILNVSGKSTVWRFAISNGPITIKYRHSNSGPEITVKVPLGGQFRMPGFHVATCSDSEGNELINWPRNNVKGIVCKRARLMFKTIEGELVADTCPSMRGTLGNAENPVMMSNPVVTCNPVVTSNPFKTKDGKTALEDGGGGNDDRSTLWLNSNCRTLFREWSASEEATDLDSDMENNLP